MAFDFSFACANSDCHWRHDSEGAIFDEDAEDEDETDTGDVTVEAILRQVEVN
jgi:hypothetical protein